MFANNSIQPLPTGRSRLTLGGVGEGEYDYVYLEAD